MIGISATEARRNVAKPHVMAYVNELKAADTAKLGIDKTRWLQEVAALAFSDITELFDRVQGGGLNLTDVKALPAHVRASIASIEMIRVKGADGEMMDVLKIKMHPKAQALDLCARHLGVLDGQGGDQEQIERMTGFRFEVTERKKK